MAWQNTYYAKGLTFKLNGVVINITGWTFRAQFRKQTADADPALLELTTANGGFVTTDAPNGRVELRILQAQLTALPAGVLVFDIMRTDISPGPIRLCGGKLRVKQPVTR